MKSVISLSKVFVFTILIAFANPIHAEYYMVYPVDLPPSEGCGCHSRYTHSHYHARKHHVHKHYSRHHTYHHKKSSFSISTYYMWQTYPGAATWIWVPTNCGCCGHWQRQKHEDSESYDFDMDRRTADDVDYPY